MYHRSIQVFPLSLVLVTAVENLSWGINSAWTHTSSSPINLSWGINSAWTHTSSSPILCNKPKSHWQIFKPFTVLAMLTAGHTRNSHLKKVWTSKIPLPSRSHFNYCPNIQASWFHSSYSFPSLILLKLCLGVITHQVGVYLIFVTWFLAHCGGSHTLHKLHIYTKLGLPLHVDPEI